MLGSICSAFRGSHWRPQWSSQKWPEISWSSGLLWLLYLSLTSVSERGGLVLPRHMENESGLDLGRKYIPLVSVVCLTILVWEHIQSKLIRFHRVSLQGCPVTGSGLLDVRFRTFPDAYVPGLCPSSHGVALDVARKMAVLSFHVHEWSGQDAEWLPHMVRLLWQLWCCERRRHSRRYSHAKFS